MDGRFHQDDLLLARTLLKQVDETIFQVYKSLLDAHAQHALALVAGMMCLYRDDLLETHLEALLASPENAFTIAMELTDANRGNASAKSIRVSPTMTAKMAHQNKQANSINSVMLEMHKHPFLNDYRDKIFSNIPHARPLIRGLLLLRENKLLVMVPYLLDKPDSACQLATAFVKLSDAGHLNDQTNVNAIISCSSAASCAADTVMLLKTFELDAYRETITDNPHYMIALHYVLTHAPDKKQLRFILQNALNKTETLKFIQYAYQTICDNKNLQFMALTSPAEKTTVILSATIKHGERKQLKSNRMSIHYRDLQFDMEASPPSGSSCRK